MPNKALGQHWLKDREILEIITSYAAITPSDTVLEIGPGLGTLTSVLLCHARQVVAVEFDKELAAKLSAQFPGKNLTIYNQDILAFDLSILPTKYKVVANIPYYITSKIIKQLMTAPHKPSLVVLVIQKEVAQRLAARPGEMSVLAVSAHIFAEVTIGEIIPAQAFFPPPKVDSQIVILKSRPKPLVSENEQQLFFRVVKAGFSAKRKKLRSSLSGGLHMSKNHIEEILKKSRIDPGLRAEALSIDDWKGIIKNI